MGKTYQCCYTNASREIGGVVTSGWQSLAVSKGIPEEAYNYCVKMQNANSTIQSAMTDERGNVLNLLEISGDGSYIYLMRTQYGLLDRLGRANMFSHAFIMPVSDIDIIGNPNNIVNVDRSSYQYNEEDAIACDGNIIRSDPLTLETALQLACMNREAYRKMIQCIYTQFSDKKIGKPLFIQYNGEDKQMFALLYCIYAGLPYFVRRNLSVASCNSNTSLTKNIIFSEKANTHDLYFDPKTGSNNLLTPRSEKRIARYGFVDYALRYTSEAEMNKYFYQLEENAIELGDSNASNERILKIAHLLIIGDDIKSIENTEIEERISDALLSKSSVSKVMEKYIASLLNEAVNRRMTLTEENEDNLNNRLGNASIDELKDACERYTICQFSMSQPTEAAKKLSKMDKTTFMRYRKILLESNDGQTILREYYSKYVIDEVNPSWETLETVRAETAALTVKPFDTDKLCWFAKKIYWTNLTCGKDALESYNNFIEFVSKATSKTEASEYAKAAKIEYWNHVTFQSFSIADIETYKFFNVGADRCTMFFDYYNTFREASRKSIDAFLAATHNFFGKYRKEIASNQIKYAISNIASSAEMYATSSRDRFELQNWVALSYYSDSNRQFDLVMELREALKRDAVGRIAELYFDYTDEIRFSDSNKQIRDIVSVILISYVKVKDSERKPIPIDVWLAIGRAKNYGNCFQIFEDYKAEILQVKDDEIIESSKLLKEDRYINLAESYVQTAKGEAHKKIRSLANEAKRQNKLNKPGKHISKERSNTQEGNFFTRLFSKEDVSDREQKTSDSDKKSDKGNKFGFFGKK